MTRTRLSHSSKPMLLLAVVVALALAGCSTAGMPNDGMEPKVTEAAARSIVERVNAVGRDTAPGGDFTVTATQNELSSFLAIGADVLAHYQEAYAQGVTPVPRQIPGIDALVTDDQWRQAMDYLYATSGGAGAVLVELRSNIQNPRVFLKADGTLVLRGTATASGVSLPLRVVIAPESSNSGYGVRLIKAQLGTVAAPEWVATLIKDAIAQGMALGNQSVVITDIAITLGEITVSGTVRE
jgi:hypothetical protein